MNPDNVPDNPTLTWDVLESRPRIDRFLATELPETSRTVIQRLIRDGHVLVNGVPTTPRYCPQRGDQITMQLPQQEVHLPQPEVLPLDVLYEDEHLLVLNKPAGMVVHPSPGHPSGTIVNALLAYRPEVRQADPDSPRPGIVHRLDRDTSGVLVVAVTRDAQQALQDQFKHREVSKYYLALLLGRVEPGEAAIEAPIGRDPVHRQRMAVLTQGGRIARTEYVVLEYLRDCTLVRAQLLTGRTHQLRVHFSSIGNPVLGDAVYGHRRQPIESPRQMLHAHQLAFAHPVTRERLSFTAEPPPDFQKQLADLRALS